jgi:hypothetical protein
LPAPSSLSTGFAPVNVSMFLHLLSAHRTPGYTNDPDDRIRDFLSGQLSWLIAEG